MKCIVAVAMVLFLLLSPAVTAAETLQLARNENAVAQTVAASLLLDIYRKAGLTATIHPLPATRATVVTLAGEKDGEVARIPAYFTRNPTLIKVEPAYYYLTTGVFAKVGSNVSVTSKADLVKYRVGILRGVAHAEAATEGLADLQVTGSYKQLYQMLEAGRIDVAIDEGINGPSTLKSLGIKDIVQVAEIARLDLHHVLIPARKELAPKISSAIKEMKKSGELKRLTKEYEAQASL